MLAITVLFASILTVSVPPAPTKNEARLVELALIEAVKRAKGKSVEGYWDARVGQSDGRTPPRLHQSFWSRWFF